MSYFPMDRDLLSSSIWSQGTPEQVKVWIYLLLAADVNTGIVADAMPGVALRCGLPLGVTKEALDYLASPDPESRTTENDGRRIEPMPGGGYQLLNYSAKRDRDWSTPRVRRWKDRQREVFSRAELGNGVVNGGVEEETGPVTEETVETAEVTQKPVQSLAQTTNTNPNPNPNQRTTNERTSPTVRQTVIPGTSDWPVLPLRPVKKRVSKDLVGEQTMAIAQSYMQGFNAMFARRLSLTPLIVQRVQSRLKDGYAGWQIMAQPLLVFANSDDRAFLKMVQPEWPLRDGKHPRTDNGRTTGAVDWLERELARLDRTWLSPGVAEVGKELGVLDILTAHGVKVRGVDSDAS